MQGTLHVEPAATGYSPLRNSFSKGLIVLMAMVGLVLLIACGNVANLLIARAFARQKEIAVRLSIGASRWQLVRQLLVESMVLSAAGGVAGILLAFWLTRGLLALIPTDGNPLLIRPEPDARILLFSIALTFATGLLFGLLPSWRASSPDLATTMKNATGSIAGSGGSLFLKKGLVTAQVALSFLLLFGAGLFVRSLQNLQSKDTGFHDIDNLVTFQIAPALNGYDEPRANQLYRELLDRIRALPGVKAAGFASVPLLHGWEWDSSVSVEGHTAFKDKSAVGRHLGSGGREAKLDKEIVGVVEDSLYEGPRQGIRRQVFVPHYGVSGVSYYVRTAVGSSAAYGMLRASVKDLDASLPVYELKTLGDQLDQTLLSERLIALLSAAFGLLATLLASIGLYGVMAFAVTRRTRELGVRMALGAGRGGVLWLVMREVMALLVAGLAIGVPAALALGRLVAAQLYDVKPADPLVTGLTVLLLATISAAAGFAPAHRASRIDPVVALRYE
jgi:ABC-type antimicrobial peptide transport system permease subunit